VFVIPALLCLWLSQNPTTQPEPQTARPSLEFDKTRFAVGERIFFWIVTTKDPEDDSAMPMALMGSARVLFTRPDGTERVDVVSQPIDVSNIPRHPSWKGRSLTKGGHTLRDDPIQLGRWTVVYEFRGVRSEPITFTVEEWPVLHDIHASFEFSTPVLLGDRNAFVTCVVWNDSKETIRFVQPGQNTNYVTYQLQKPGWGLSGFVPERVLAAAAGHAHRPFTIDRLDWDAVRRFPNVTLAPGQSYRLRLRVTDALGGKAAVAKIPDGDYDLRFFAEWQLLIGAPNGRWQDFLPIRLMAESATTASRNPRSSFLYRPQVAIEPIQHCLDGFLRLRGNVTAFEDGVVLLRRTEHLEHRQLGARVGQVEILPAVDHEHGHRHVRGVIHRLDLGRQVPRLETAGHEHAGLEPGLDGEPLGSELRSEAHAVKRNL